MNPNAKIPLNPQYFEGMTGSGKWPGDLPDETWSQLPKMFLHFEVPCVTVVIQSYLVYFAFAGHLSALRKLPDVYLPGVQASFFLRFLGYMFIFLRIGMGLEVINQSQSGMMIQVGSIRKRIFFEYMNDTSLIHHLHTFHSRCFLIMECPTSEAVAGSAPKFHPPEDTGIQKTNEINMFRRFQVMIRQ